MYLPPPIIRSHCHFIPFLKEASTTRTIYDLNWDNQYILNPNYGLGPALTRYLWALGSVPLPANRMEYSVDYYSSASLAHFLNTSRVGMFSEVTINNDFTQFCSLEEEELDVILEKGLSTLSWHERLTTQLVEPTDTCILGSNASYRSRGARYRSYFTLKEVTLHTISKALETLPTFAS